MSSHPLMDRCEEKLAEWSDGAVEKDDKVLIDRNSFRVSHVERWNPKYYKTLQGGVRIDFHFAKAECP